MKYDHFTVNDATYLLLCHHSIGKARKMYGMPSIKLKDMGGGRVKLLVFGDRFWHGRYHIKRVRYVNWNRVITRKYFTPDMELVPNEKAT